MTDENWKLARRKGIGGSDAAAILGFSPWKSPMDVYLDKTGMAEEPDANRQFLLELGQQLEPVIARLYERETGKHLQQPSPALWHHSKHPVLLGTPDRIIAGERGVELKSENQFQNEFGEPGTDQVPYHYLIQCAHYMALSNMPAWDVALLKSGASFAIYTIHRDLELEEFIISELLLWWESHIVAQKPPDVDSSDAWKRYLRQKFPSNILPIKSTDSAVMDDIRRLAASRLALEHWDEEKTEIENRLKLAIGEHEGFAGDFGKLTWRKAKDSQAIDYERAFNYLASHSGIAPDMLEVMLSNFTVTRPGSRRLLFQPRKGWTPYGGAPTEKPAGEFPSHPPALQERNRESAT